MSGRFDLEALVRHVGDVLATRGADRAQLADAIGVSRSTITRLFQGNTPTLDVAAALSVWADLDLGSYVIPFRQTTEGDDPMTAPDPVCAHCHQPILDQPHDHSPHPGHTGTCDPLRQDHGGDGC